MLGESPPKIVRPGTYNSPLRSSIVLDESPSQIVGPNTHDFQEIKNMIVNLQLDLQEERSKRECLEEKMRKFEGDLPPHSKIFLEQAFANFSNRKFGLEFADPRSFSKISKFSLQIRQIFLDWQFRGILSQIFYW